MKRKWTKQSANEYIIKAKEKGLTYWSAKDFLKNHKKDFINEVIHGYRKNKHQ